MYCLIHERLDTSLVIEGLCARWLFYYITKQMTLQLFIFYVSVPEPFLSVSHERHFVTWVLQRSVSTSGRKWDNSPSWFCVSCCTISTRFMFTTFVNVRSQNVFRSELLLNHGWIPNLRPSFLKTVLMNEVRSSTQMMNCRHTLKRCGEICVGVISTDDNKENR